MARVLVTGATGFIGQYVVRELLRRGHEVIASSSNKEKAVSADWFDRVTYRALDLGQLEPGVNYFDYFERPDKMIHLAWEGLPNYKADFHITDNLPRHQRFLENMITNGLIDLTVTGTCFEYGMVEGELNEEMPSAPNNAYAIAKDELRKYLESLSVNSSFHFKWMRLFYMYGEGQNSKSLFSQLNAALNRGDEAFNMSGGEQVRDFLHIEKVAEYIVTTSLQDRVDGIINCCSGNPVTVRSFVEDYLEDKRKIKLNLGYYPYADYEPMRFWGDASKLNSIV